MKSADLSKGESIGKRGTKKYMSPEMLKGKLLGPSSDVYSIGVIIYKMVELKMPFTPEHQDLYVKDAIIKDPNLV